MNTFLRGQLLEPEDRSFRYHPDALITIVDGKIQQVEETPSDCTIPISHPNCILLPGFTDSHIHFPQTNVCGSASGPLLPWLKKTVFPEEAKFADNSYANEVLEVFCESLVRSGVCAAAIFSSSHYSATDILFQGLERSGIKALAGMTLMNRNAPSNILTDVEQAKKEMQTLIADWHGKDNDRLRYCITPRFAIACDERMLQMAGDLSKEHNLWVQTHISENNDEIEFIKSLFPDLQNYLHVYDHFGLLHERSLYAHCIHFSDKDWKQFSDANAVVTHCPDSNFFLGSGCMEYNKARSFGAKMSIGTDVGAGRSFSMRLATARGYDASLLVGSPVPAEELLWSATIGGAIHLQFNRPWSDSADADIIAIPVENSKTKSRIIDNILFQHDHPTVQATYVRGTCVYSV